MRCEVIADFVFYYLYYFSSGNNFVLRENCTFFSFFRICQVLCFLGSLTRLRSHLGFLLDQLDGQVDFAVNGPFYRLEFN